MLIGDVADRDALAAELGRHGASEVLHATGEAFGAYGGASWAAAMQAALADTGSTVVTAAGSPRGNEVLAHLAARLDVPMAANVIAHSELSPFTVTRQVLGGTAMEEMRLESKPALFTVAGHSWVAQAVDGGPATWQEFSPEVAEADLVARVHSTGVKEADASGSLKSASDRGRGGPWRRQRGWVHRGRRAR